MYKFIWLVPLLPLMGAAINGIFGRWFRFPEKLIGGIAVGSVALSFLISIAAISSYGFSNNSLWPNPYVSTQTAFTWIGGGAVRQSLGQAESTTITTANRQVTVPSPRASLLNIEWSYQLDPLSAVFMLIVTGVGLCIFVFATGYMHGDTGYYRFFAYMGLFMFSMLVLLLGSNFVLMIGACGKSAQFPLHVWLPDAMAGPTPVSALIHAATMVTAGLYMLTRTNVIFQHSQTMMLVVAIIGAFTAIFAATIGITQNDIKKVLAYSTVSQLGFMFLACGVGAFVIGIFHVVTHAFFKALMFLGAGSVIHGMHHEQDMRRMGGLRKYMPYTYLTFLAGWLAICGIIPFSGFWSKDEILWNAASTTHIPFGWLFWIIGTIAATCTAFYMTRLMAMTFWGREKFLEAPAGGEADEAHALAYAKGKKPHDAVKFAAGDRPRHEPGEHVGPVHETAEEHVALDIENGHGAHTPHESPPSMGVPLVALAILATVGGLIGVGPVFKFITGREHPAKRLNIVNWIDPTIWNPQTRAFGKEEQVEATNEPGKPPREAAAPLASSASSTLEQQRRAEIEGG